MWDGFVEETIAVWIHLLKFFIMALPIYLILWLVGIGIPDLIDRWKKR